MKLALLIAAVDPRIGGVLVFGDRGTGKSTAVRALAALLPPMRCAGCRYAATRRRSCAVPARPAQAARRAGAGRRPAARRDRGPGRRRARPRTRARRGREGVRAGAAGARQRGFLYIDEVNLLEDHLVDLLLDVAASGENVVEREGLSVRHPARFVLVGSGNPEEGELRPQLLDRFGLSVEVRTPQDLRGAGRDRASAATRSSATPAAFAETWRKAERKTLKRLARGARGGWRRSRCPRRCSTRASQLCMAVGADGLRGELTLMRAGARARGARRRGDGRPTRISPRSRRGAAPPAAPQRARRDRLDRRGSSARWPNCSRHDRRGRRAASIRSDDALTAARLCAIDPGWAAWCCAAAARCATRWSRRCARRCAPARRCGACRSHIDDDRLLGGIDLGATLAAGRAVRAARAARRGGGRRGRGADGGAHRADGGRLRRAIDAVRRRARWRRARCRARSSRSTMDVEPTSACPRRWPSVWRSGSTFPTSRHGRHCPEFAACHRCRSGERRGGGRTRSAMTTRH